jgi:hypothetical protein
MTDAVSPRPPPGAAGPAAPALGFLLGSFIALIAGCGLLWGQPDRWWAGDGGTAVLTLGYLLAVGWLGSLLFGAAYLLLPVLTGSRWWSPRLAWVHLALHVGGGGWLWIDPGAVWAGGVLFLGALLFVINQQVTANRLSRWDPANLAFTVAMYWLVVAGALAVAPGLAAVSPIGVAADESLMRALAFAGLVGALALAVVGVALKWLPMFLVGTARPAGLSWLGLLLINVGLLAWLAGESGGLIAWRLPAWYALLSGFGALAIDVARLLWSGRRRWTGAEVLLGVGGVLFIVLLVAVRYPPRGGDWLAPEAASWLPAWFLLLALGPLTFTGLGLGLRILPFVVWHLRLARHQIGQAPPVLGDLMERAALPPLILSAALGWGYLAAGLWQQEKAGLTLAAVCYLLAALFLIVALYPAGRALRTAFFPPVSPPA